MDQLKMQSEMEELVSTFCIQVEITKKAFPTGKLSSNYRAETSALLHAVQMILDSDQHPSRVVFFTYSKSVLQALMGEDEDKQIQDSRTAMHRLSSKANVALQWIPSHCGVYGNERADALSKTASSMAKPRKGITYKETKAIIYNAFQKRWNDTHGGYF